MKIKVTCPCSARFEFEVEPVLGRMPVAINCPVCGADATALANEIIAQQSSAAPASGLRIAHAHPATPPATAEPITATTSSSETQFCPKHKTELAVETCRVCGKPICLKCMEQFGYVCSVYCRQQATARRMSIPVYAQQKSIAAARSDSFAGKITWAVVIVLALVVGFWVWYSWFGRNPKVVFSQPVLLRDLALSSFRPGEFYQLIGPGQLLSIKSKQLSVYDVVEGKTIWSAALPAEIPEPRVIVTTNDLWVVAADRVARFDRQTGAAKAITDSQVEAFTSEKAQSVSYNNGTILMVTGSPDANESLVEISLPAGTVQVEKLDLPASNHKASNAKGKSIHAPDEDRVQTTSDDLKTALKQRLAPESADNANIFSSGKAQQPFVAAGPNVIQINARLLEHKVIQHTALKPKGESVLNGNVTASQSLDMAEEMLNDARREKNNGVVEEDVSRYQITLHRQFARDIPDWTGEVTGPPRLFSLKTVDILATSETIYVFDKNNKKLWEAKLTYPTAASFSSEHPPALEIGDALYFADLGMLTRYDLASGNVRWRYNTFGISKIQEDAHGDLYLDTTTAGPESIEYSQQINIRNKVHPVIVKLAPDTGKVLWRVESIGERTLLSGKFLYATWLSKTYAALRLEEGPEANYFLHLLNPANGREIWTFQRHSQPIKTEVQNNWIMVQLPDKVLVLKFFSL